MDISISIPIVPISTQNLYTYLMSNKDTRSSHLIWQAPRIPKNGYVPTNDELILCQLLRLANHYLEQLKFFFNLPEKVSERGEMKARFLSKLLGNIDHNNLNKSIDIICLINEIIPYLKYLAVLMWTKLYNMLRQIL